MGAMRKMLTAKSPKKKKKAKSAFKSLVKREKAAKVRAKKASGVMRKSNEKAKKARRKGRSQEESLSDSPSSECSRPLGIDHPEMHWCFILEMKATRLMGSTHKPEQNESK